MIHIRSITIRRKSFMKSNPDIHKHLTIDTKVRLGVYLACPNITKGIEVAGKLTIDGSGSFNTSFLSNKRGTVINVTSTGTLIVEDPVKFRIERRHSLVRRMGEECN